VVRTRILTTGSVLGAALLARLAVLAFAARGGIPTGEGAATADLATNLLRGDGITLSPSMMYPEEAGRGLNRMQQSTFDFWRRVDGFYGVLRPGTPTAFFMPGYIVFEAGIFAVAGAVNLLAVRAVQLLLGLGAVLTGMALAGRFLPARWVPVAGLLMALDPFGIYFEAIPYMQGLFNPLFTLSLLMSVRALESPSASRSVLAGLAWSSAFLVRPMALPAAACFLAAVLAGGRRQPHKVARGAVFALAFTLPLVPWAARQHAVTGEWRITPTQGGVNMWESNARMFSSQFAGEQEGATMLYGPLRESMLPVLERPDLAEFPEFRNEPEAYRDSVLYSRTIRFLSANPVLLARLPLLRFADFFKLYPFNPFPLHYNVAGALHFGPVLALAGGGMILALRRRNAQSLFLVLVTAAYAAAHIAMSAGTPFRVALDAPLVIFAVLAAREIVTRAGRGAGA
jgi:hypothetical protein